MRKVCSLAVMVMTGAVAVSGGPMGAQDAPAAGPGAEVQRSYAGLKVNILKAAEGMPAEAYSYKPVPDIRTFARVVNHVTEAQARSCAAVNGEASSITVPPETADKAAIVEALKASFAACDKAFGSTTTDNMTAMLTMGKMTRSRAGLLWGTVSHDNEQYATLALYMRLKGIAPPSQER